MHYKVLLSVDIRADENGETRIFIGNPVRNQLISGALQVSFPTSRIEQAVRFVWLVTFAATLVVTLTTIVAAAYIADRSFRSLRDLTRTANEIAEVNDNFENQFPRDELSQLTQAFTTMSGQLRAQIDALKTERSKLSAVLQQMTDGVVIADMFGRIQLFNEAAEKLFNIPASTALNRSLAEVLRDHRLVELWQKCTSTDQEQAVYLEFRQLNLFLQCIATPLQESLPGSVLLLFQDLTRIRRLETVRRDFISNISHELRTPLASLKALTETLQDGALDDPPAARRFLAKMETEVDALGHMVSELLELTRIESGKVPLQLNAERPIDLLKPANDRLIVQAERNNLTILLNCPEDLPLVLADSPRMQQVIVNLLHNAIKFTPPGGQITIGALQANESVIFFIEDTGVGIAADDLSRIFERFYKADRARSGGGTGLGLAISRHLVEAHGGKIWVESIETKGSRFSFSLITA